MNGGFSAALLAGGRSRRMGCDKALLEFGDPPQLLWKRQLKLLSKVGADQLMVSHNAEQIFVVPRDVLLVPDDAPDSGPLGGLVSCLQRSKYERLLLLAVDLPYMTTEFLGHMLSRGTGVVLRDPSHGRYEPVVAIYTRECLSIAQTCLREGELSMRSLIETLVAAGLIEEVELDPQNLSLFKNLNSPEDL